MSSLSDRISLLRQRATDIAAQLTSLGDRRRSYSLAAAEGDNHARHEISGIDVEQADLLAQQQTIDDSISVSEALQKQEALDEQRKRRSEREVAAHTTAVAVIALQAEIDERMVELRQAFERRSSLLAELARSELADPNLLNKLSSKLPATRAACCHGLDRFISIERTSALGRMPLSDANVLLAGIGKAPDPDKPAAKEKRVRLQ
jgi:hypothetical protein